MSSPNLLPTDVEEQLRDVVRQFLAARAPFSAVVRAYDEPVDFSSLWSRLCIELGIAGLLVPEEHGGSGVGLREAATVAEEMGRAVAPVPFLTSAVVATTALLAADAGELLAQLADGSRVAALAVPFTAATLPSNPGFTVGVGGLQGGARSVAGAAGADDLLVVATGAAGLELHRVSTAAAGVSIVPVSSLDMSRPVADIVLDGVVDSTRLHVADVRAVIDRALLAGAAVLASEQVGVASWCFDSTLSYIKERYQFGRAVGSFQVVKHRMADLWAEIGHAGATARYAVDVIDRDDPDAAVAVAVAQSYCSAVAVHAAEECIQLHGGIGMTWEFPAHVYLKRAKADEIALGSPTEHRARLATVIDLPPA